MPAYNASQFLTDSIESVLCQTYAHLELLITDDNSTDECTLAILKHYEEKDSRVKVFRLAENAGPGVARNMGIEHAQGRYIAFCDSDDRWMPEKLEVQIAYMQAHRCALCCSSYIICNDAGEECGIYIAPETITFGMLLKDNKIGCLTAVYDREMLGEKFYMPTLRKRQDWEMFLRILQRCRVAHGMKSPLAYYRERSGSVSQGKLHLIKYNARVYRDVMGVSPMISYLYLVFVFMPNYGLKVIRKHIDSFLYLRNKKMRKG